MKLQKFPRDYTALAKIYVKKNWEETPPGR